MIFIQLVLLLIALLEAAIAVYFKKTKIPFSNYLWNSLFYQFISTQPGIVIMILEVLACKKIAGTNYLLGNTRFQCNNQQNNETLILPLLLLWIAIFPLLIFFLLKKHSKTKKTHKKHKKMSISHSKIQKFIENQKNDTKI